MFKKLITPIVDCHVHLFDFLQKGKGIKELLKAMDEANVEKAVVMGMPLKKKWEQIYEEEPYNSLANTSHLYYFSLTDEYVAEEFLSLSAEERKRIAPIICGFNPTDLSAISQVEKLCTKYDFWKGMGELLFEHDDVTQVINEENAKMDHKAMQPIYKFAAEKNLPLLIHHNAVNIGAQKNYAYLNDMLKVLEHYPKTKIVWAHAGVGKIGLNYFGERHTRLLDKLLGKYSNLYIDISWLAYDKEVCDKKMSPHKYWIDLIIKHPSRFMLGSDVVGKYEGYSDYLARFNGLLTKLPKEVMQKIARENADKLFFS